MNLLKLLHARGKRDSTKRRRAANEKREKQPKKLFAAQEDELHYHCRLPFLYIILKCPRAELSSLNFYVCVVIGPITRPISRTNICPPGTQIAANYPPPLNRRRHCFCVARGKRPTFFSEMSSAGNRVLEIVLKFAQVLGKYKNKYNFSQIFFDKVKKLKSVL